MDLEEISRKADKERSKAKAGQVQSSAKEETHRTYDAFSFHTYSKIFPDPMNVALWALLCAPALVLAILYFTSDEPAVWELYGAVGIVGVFLLRWGFEFIRKFASYGSYKNFSASLGFELEGWDKLGAYPKQLYFRHWSRENVVQVFVFEHATQAELRQVKEVLNKFIARTDHWFYYSTSDPGKKTDWEYHGSLRIRGSADHHVIGEIYTLINEDLRVMHEKKKIIRAVSIKFDPDIRMVEPPASTDTMS